MYIYVGTRGGSSPTCSRSAATSRSARPFSCRRSLRLTSLRVSTPWRPSSNPSSLRRAPRRRVWKGSGGEGRRHAASVLGGRSRSTQTTAGNAGNGWNPCRNAANKNVKMCCGGQGLGAWGWRWRVGLPLPTSSSSGLLTAAMEMLGRCHGTSPSTGCRRDLMRRTRQSVKPSM